METKKTVKKVAAPKKPAVAFSKEKGKSMKAKKEEPKTTAPVAPVEIKAPEAPAIPPPEAPKEPKEKKETKKQLRVRAKQNELKKIEVKNKALSATGEGILGFWAYWDCESVNVSRKKFLEVLTQVGVPEWEKYAMEIGPSTAFHRALEEMVKDETLTLVEEDAVKIVYQLDDRELHKAALDATVNNKVEFKYKSRIAVAKEPLQAGKGPDEFVISDDETLRKEVIRLFKITSETYTTTEFRKFVKRTFAGEADLIRMRKAGGVYFVPYVGREVGDKMTKLFEATPGDSVFDFVPMPEGPSSRRALKRAIISEAMGLMEDLQAKVGKLDDDSTRIESTVENRLKEVLVIRTKVEAYASYLEDKSQELLKSLGEVEDKIKKYITAA
jgi:hypothetical protein